MRQAELVRLTVVLAAVIIPAPIAIAQQSPPPTSSRFEVAAIKPGDPNAIAAQVYPGTPGGQYRMMNVPLKQWVEIGLSVSDYALKAPAWLDTSRFDLDAKLPPGHTASPEMMKALLIERFGLKWHEETSIVSGYELIAEKKVLAQPTTFLERLRPHGSSSGPTLIQAVDMPMEKLAEALGKALGKPVVDATHLTGGYDIKLQWKPSSEAELAARRQYDSRYGTNVDNLPDSVFTAVREQLGLRLQPAKIPSRVIVIDNINPQPTSN